MDVRTPEGYHLAIDWRAESGFVLIYRLGETPQLASLEHEIANETCLPGLKLPVARLFE